MTGAHAIGILAGLMVGAAFACRTQARLRAFMICAQVLLLWYAVLIGSVTLLVLNAAVFVVNLVRLWGLSSGSKRSRTASDMDHDVQERIRRISAESRYSSAGIEF